MADPRSGGTDRPILTRVRRILPVAIVVLAVGAVVFSIWMIAVVDEPSWVRISADVMAWTAVAGIVIMVAISRRHR